MRIKLLQLLCKGLKRHKDVNIVYLQLLFKETQECEYSFVTIVV